MQKEEGLIVTVMRKVLAMLLCLSLCTGLVPAAGAEAPEIQGDVDAGNLSFSGDSSIGTLAARSLRQEEEPDTMPGAVTDISVSGAVASFKLGTDRAAVLVAELCEEDGSELLSSAACEVGAGDMHAEVTFEIEQMPEFFVVKAYLLDAETQALISEVYISREYTQEFQAFLGNTAEDYPQELVLNLDGDIYTNYLVFSEDTVRCIEQAGTNTLTDHGDGSFTIHNADARVKALSAGDSFAHTGEDGCLLVLQVASVSVSGNDVTIIEDTNAALEDIFAYIRLDETSAGAEATLNPEGMDDSVSFLGVSEETVDSFQPAEEELYWNGTDEYYATEFNADEHSGGLSLSAARAVPAEEQVGVSFHYGVMDTGTLDLALTMEVKFYKSLSWQYISVKGDLSLKTALSMHAPIIETRIGLGEPTYFLGVTGLKVVFPAYFIFEAEVSGEISATLTTTIGFAYDSEVGYTNLSSWPNVEAKAELSGNVFIGIEMEPMVTTVFDRKGFSILKVSFVKRFGVEIEGSLAVLSYESETGDSIHACKKCFSGTMNLVASAEVNCVLFKIIDYTYKLLEIKAKVADFYFSFDYGDGGWNKTCPHLAYKTDILVRMKDGSAVAGAEVYVVENSGARATDTDGRASFYLPDGQYSVIANTGDHFREKDFTIQDAGKEIVLVLDDEETDPGQYSGGSGGGSDGDGDIEWRIDEKNKTVYFYGTGMLSNSIIWGAQCFSCKRVVILNGIDEIRSNAFNTVNLQSRWFIESVSIPGSVTKIGAYAFAGQNKLTSVRMANGVTDIGYAAFSGCTSLNPVLIPGSVTGIDSYAFAGCQALTSISIPSSVSNLGAYAFGSCTSLRSIDLPSGLTSIGNYAFDSCTALTSIAIPQSVTDLGFNVFRNCSALSSVTISHNVASIGSGTFYGCTALRSIVIPQGVTSIDGCAFQGCTSLRSVSLPQNLTSIGGSVFSGCSSLRAVRIPDGVTTVERETFDGCSSLVSLTIPESMTSFREDAFRGCTALKSAGPIGSGCSIEFGWTNPFPYELLSVFCQTLTSVILPQGVVTIDSDAFCDWVHLVSVTIPDSVTDIGRYAFSECSALKSVTIPNSVTSLGSGAFYGCTSLSSATISKNITSFGSDAFSGCTALVSLTLLNGITDIGNSAFQGCTALKSATIPGSVTRIGESAFDGCTALASVTIPDSVSDIGTGAFCGCAALASATLGSGLNGIGNDAFKDCAVLSSLTLRGNPTFVGGDAFKGCALLKSAGPSGGGYNVKFIGTDSLPFQVCKQIPTLTSIVIPNGISSIDGYGFKDCTALASVTIPDSVTEIGTSAFNGCTALSSVTIPGSVTTLASGAFYGCTALRSVTISEGVSGIDGSAFSECPLLKTAGAIGSGSNVEFAWTNTIPGNMLRGFPDLTSVTIPNSVTSIGQNAFSGCNALASIAIPDSVTSIGQNAFNGCRSLASITIPGSVTSMGDCAFYGCEALKTLTISEGAAIGSYAFQNCTALASVKLPGTFTCVSNDPFYNCPLLKTAGPIGSGCNIEFACTGTVPNNVFNSFPVLSSVTIPNTVTAIGDSAFQECRNLASVTIPNSVTSIGQYAFCNCFALASVTIPNSVTSIGQNAFCNCFALTSVTIPASVTSMGDGAFWGCSSLKSVTVSEGVPAIGQYVFERCTALTTVALPNSITRLSNGAFRGCTSLVTFRVPNNVTSIGSDVFTNCTALKSIQIPKSVTSVSVYSFEGCTALTEVYYSGTQEQWDAISVDSGNEPLRSATVHCSYMQPEPDFILPAALTTIDAEAFKGAAFTYVKLSEQTTTIGENAFADCSLLAYAYIPEATVNIHPLAFGDKTELTIFGKANSAAETFADEHGFTFVAVS